MATPERVEQALRDAGFDRLPISRHPAIGGQDVWYRPRDGHSVQVGQEYASYRLPVAHLISLLSPLRGLTMDQMATLLAVSKELTDLADQLSCVSGEDSDDERTLIKVEDALRRLARRLRGGAADDAPPV